MICIEQCEKCKYMKGGTGISPSWVCSRIRTEEERKEAEKGDKCNLFEPNHPQRTS